MCFQIANSRNLLKLYIIIAVRQTLGTCEYTILCVLDGLLYYKYSVMCGSSFVYGRVTIVTVSISNDLNS